MSILGTLTTQQVVNVYNVFAAKNGTATVKKFRDADTGKKRLQDISRGLDRTAVVSALKKAGIPTDTIKMLPTTPTTVAIPETPAVAPTPEPVKKVERTNVAEKVIAAESAKERVKVEKQEKKQAAAIRKEIKMSEGCTEVFRALRSNLKKKDDEIDTTALATKLQTSTTAVIKAVAALQKLGLVKVEDDSPDDNVKLWYVSLTRDGLVAPVPGTKAPAEAQSKKAPLPGSNPGPRSNSNGKKIYRLVKDNPRREGTHGHKSFSIIKDGMTYEQYKAAGGRNNDLAWDLDHGYVELR